MKLTHDIFFWKEKTFKITNSLIGSSKISDIGATFIFKRFLLCYLYRTCNFVEENFCGIVVV